MDILPPEHPFNRKVHDLVRRLQQKRGKNVDPEERCAHLETIVNRLFTKMDSAVTKRDALEYEREAINKKLVQSQDEIDDTQKQIDDAQEDKREAEARRTKNLQTKPQQSRVTTEAYTEEFNNFLKTRHMAIHQLGEDNTWDFPQKLIRKYEQEYHTHTMHHMALANVLQQQQQGGLSPRRKNVVK